MNRKNFILTCGFACVGSTALATLLESCSSAVYYAQASVINNQIVLKKTEFLETNIDNIVQRKFVVVKVAKLPVPICVYKINDENYSALLMKCSHKGCELRPQGDYLMCPCHGSEFSNEGIVQNPPAQKNLITFTIKSDNDTLYIQL
jgi:cytochrome b6-f complex iron-sulfur subunit